MHQSSRIRLECIEMPEKVKKFPRAIQVMLTQYSLGVQRSGKKKHTINWLVNWKLMNSELVYLS